MDLEVQERSSVMNIENLHKLYLASTAVTTDSRTIKGGELFFALKGENFDGNEYAMKALESGASYAVVDKGSKYDGADERIISFPDTLQALKSLALYHREHSLVDGERLIVIGLTGTNGKTTTKELIREVLSKKYTVTATQGNLNNDIGVPLSLLKINAQTQLAVIEMGANHPDDIEKLVTVARPDYGLITNVGKAHLLGFGSFDGVKAAKGQLYDYVHKFGKAVFLNADDADLCSMAQSRAGMDTIKYGIQHCGVELYPSDENNPYLRMSLPSGKAGERKEINTKLVGSYNANNVLAAIAIGLHFGVAIDDAIDAIEAYQPANNRSQMMKTQRNSLIVDAYNANPTSMSAALDNFAAAVSDAKVALLGDMRELGPDSVSEHITIVEKIKTIPMKLVCLVGEEFSKALQLSAKSDNMLWFPDSEALAVYLEKEKLESSLVLIKGSRGIQMEKTIAQL